MGQNAGIAHLDNTRRSEPREVESALASAYRRLLRETGEIPACSAVAKAAGLRLARETVRCALMSQGLEVGRPARKRKFNDDGCRQLAERVRAGETIASLAREFKVDSKTIRDAIARITQRQVEQIKRQCLKCGMKPIAQWLCGRCRESNRRAEGGE